MTNPQKTPTQKEIEEAKERIRKIALKNLKAGNLMNLASAFLVEESGVYGEAGGSAVQEFKYWPSFDSALKSNDLKSGEERNLYKESILASRQGAGNGNGAYKQCHTGGPSTKGKNTAGRKMALKGNYYCNQGQENSEGS